MRTASGLRRVDPINSQRVPDCPAHPFHGLVVDLSEALGESRLRHGVQSVTIDDRIIGDTDRLMIDRDLGRQTASGCSYFGDRHQERLLVRARGLQLHARLDIDLRRQQVPLHLLSQFGKVRAIGLVKGNFDNLALPRLHANNGRLEARNDLPRTDREFQRRGIT